MVLIHIHTFKPRERIWRHEEGNGTGLPKSTIREDVGPRREA